MFSKHSDKKAQQTRCVRETWPNRKVFPDFTILIMVSLSSASTNVGVRPRMYSQRVTCGRPSIRIA
eukprot:7805052-Prorocentrum_lima.AAC.1